MATSGSHTRTPFVARVLTAPPWCAPATEGYCDSEGFDGEVQSSDMSELMLQDSKCILCGETLLPDLPKVIDSFSGDVFSIWRCPKCGLGRTIPPPPDVNAFYGPTYHGARHGGSEKWANRRRLRMLEQVGPPGAGRVLVDVGCGDGSFLKAAHGHGWRVAGTELTISHSRHPDFHIETSLKAFDGLTPNVATLWHSLEHLSDPLQTMQTLREMLSPEGIVIIAVPNSTSAQARLTRRWWLHLDVPRHLFHWGPRSIDLLLKTAGFEPIRRWNQELEYDAVGWAQSVLSVGLRRHASYFDIVSRRPLKIKARTAWGHAAAGAVLSLLSLPVIPMTTALRCGASLVVAGKVRT